MFKNGQSVSTPEGRATVIYHEGTASGGCVAVSITGVPPYKAYRVFDESDVSLLEDGPTHVEALKGSVDEICTPEHYRVPGYGGVRDYVDAVLDRDAGIWPPSVEAVRADVIEYVSRAPRKGGVDDLKKAVRCLEQMIGRLG